VSSFIEKDDDTDDQLIVWEKYRMLIQRWEVGS